MIKNRILSATQLGAIAASGVAGSISRHMDGGTDTAERKEISANFRTPPAKAAVNVSDLPHSVPVGL